MSEPHPQGTSKLLAGVHFLFKSSKKTFVAIGTLDTLWYYNLKVTDLIFPILSYLREKTKLTLFMIDLYGRVPSWREGWTTNQ